MRQSVLGRLLDYGTVIVRGTGGGINPLAYVSEPLRLRRARLQRNIVMSAWPPLHARSAPVFSVYPRQRFLHRPAFGEPTSGSSKLALPNKHLARSNKSGGRAETTKGQPTERPAMSNILKPIDLADRAIRRAVFAMLDAAERRANRKGSERLLWRQERDKHQLREFIGGRP
jgi:hypothetical protein